LNILDAECYFKLLECMQQQDLAGALLQYDEINRKGFEGDLVLNGFAEFIRNLLVCKDEKAAVLLDVVESFKEKYIATAKEVEPALLISALNILNAAEINYKGARNKRLHVELALIKLCYLQQAIEITADGNSISKKKVVEPAKALAFRQIKPFAVKQTVDKTATNLKTTVTESAKLIIETPRNKESLVKEDNPNNTYGSQKAETKQPATRSKIAALDKIRNQYKENGNSGNGNGNANHALKKEELEKAWAEYVIKLKADKNPAAQPFDLAILRIKDDNSFEAVTANTIEKQFIEQDRNHLFAFLQEKLHNRLLQFSVTIEENTDNRPEIEITLSSKEQFQKMAELYPMVWELKERLKLDLDY